MRARYRGIRGCGRKCRGQARRIAGCHQAQAGDMQETTEEDAALKELAIHVPVPVAVPRLLYADATPEALSHALATGWPSAAVLSAEAGAVFGAHGMGYETILRNLALLNVFWDGGEIAVDRRRRRCRPSNGSAALALLADHGRARLEEDGRRRFVVVNPALYQRLVS